MPQLLQLGWGVMGAEGGRDSSSRFKTIPGRKEGEEDRVRIKCVAEEEAWLKGVVEP